LEEEEDAIVAGVGNGRKIFTLKVLKMMPHGALKI
jgi:hypothetical protein